ncbi:MAG: nucleoside-triphosphate diphosphatase [Coxiella sp. DG_40]|nr:MAG: nucleoside-triphosphate diphosphatase [Coxiella sp. DG_40]
MSKYNQIVLASDNPGKLREIKKLLANLPYEIIPQAELSVPKFQEGTLTFVENAILKARHASQHTRLPAIADDSGLEIDALNGEPGIYSARYAGSDATDQENIAKVLRKLRDIPKQKRGARFQCVIVYLKHIKDPSPIIAQGTWEGSILFQEQGKNGFGYDPIFYIPTHKCSAADLPINIKNKLSHRGQALRKLLKELKL